MAGNESAENESAEERVVIIGFKTKEDWYIMRCCKLFIYKKYLFVNYCNRY